MSESVVRRSQFPSEKKPHGYWDDFTNVRRETLAFIERAGTLGVMPKQRELQNAGLSMLANALQQHGGHAVIAGQLGLTYVHKRGAWDDFSNVKRELLAFIAQNNTPGRMPTSSELEKAGRGDLRSAIQKHGGLLEVARKLKLKPGNFAKPSNYWDERANLDKELLNYVKQCGTPHQMPTQKELARAGRSDLVHAIHKYGGHGTVAKQLGLTLPHRIMPAGYWDDLANVKKEIALFNEQRGTAPA